MTEPQDWNTRRVAAARLQLLEAQKELTRAATSWRATAGAAVGPGRQGVPLRDRRERLHLDTLVARATGKEPEPFWDGWSRLQQEYDRRLPA